MKMDVGENDCMISQENDFHQQETTSECPMESNCPTTHHQETDGVPKIGMTFDCEDSAYEFYKEYGHRIGFSVRKQLVKRTKEGLVKKRTFCCSKQGERALDYREEEVIYHYAITRVGCLAHMTCLLQKNGVFAVVSFKKEHNHEFTPSPMKHMLRSKRKITPAQAAVADDADKSGISIKSTIDLLSMQAGGRENLGFLDVDYKNYIYSKRITAMHKGDGRVICNYLHKMQLKDQSYFYLIQLDDDAQIMNIFWADGRSVVDY